MTHEIRKRIVRRGNAGRERAPLRYPTGNADGPLPELMTAWARETAADHRERVVVGTVFTDQETTVLEAIDNYAAQAFPARTRCRRS